jgi:small conductance mechanosensitive channel
MWEIILPLVRAFLNAILLGFGGAVITYLVTRFVTRILSKWVSLFWSRLLGTVTALGLTMWTIKIVLDSTGAAGLAVVLITAITGAFALGSSIAAADLVAGVSLFFARPYEVGHMVSIAENEGIVNNISLFLTILESTKGDMIYIRNSEVINHNIINYSTNPGHLISVTIQLPVDQDLNVAIAAIEKAIVGFSPELAETRLTPVILVENIMDEHFIIEVRAYVIERFDYSSEKTRLFTLSTNAILEAGLTL